MPVVVTNTTATPLGLWDTDSAYHVAGAMGGTAELEPDMQSAQVLDMLSLFGVVTLVEEQAPTNTVAPSITGTTQVGSVLTCEDGEWSGNPEPTFTRQWKADGVNISGATGKTRTLQEAQLGAEITVTVTATNSAGSESVTSAAVGPVTEAG